MDLVQAPKGQNQSQVILLNNVEYTEILNPLVEQMDTYLQIISLDQGTPKWSIEDIVTPSHCWKVRVDSINSFNALRSP